MKDVWIVGAGAMGREYAKVLLAIDVHCVAVCRSSSTAKTFLNAYPNATCHTGGLKSFLAGKPKVVPFAIIAVPIEELVDCQVLLLQYGVKNILVEKPGGLSVKKLQNVLQISKEKGATVSIAYNRRFYQSTLKAKEIIAESGGVSSFRFDFTELSHHKRTINAAEARPIIKRAWLLANSTHVIDLSFFLCGKPDIDRFVCWSKQQFSDGQFPRSIFQGAGFTENSIPFSYLSDWKCPGRWKVEINCPKKKILLCPLEEVSTVEHGPPFSLPAKVKIDNNEHLDIDFKPGLYLQVTTWLEDPSHPDLLALEKQIDLMKSVYSKIGGAHNTLLGNIMELNMPIEDALHSSNSTYEIEKR